MKYMALYNGKRVAFYTRNNGTAFSEGKNDLLARPYFPPNTPEFNKMHPLHQSICRRITEIQMKLDPRFKNTEYAVEADSYTRQSLWEQWSTQAMFKRPNCNNINWEQDCMGCLLQIGQLDNRPVNIEFYWAKLNGHSILFYNACSQLVDHAMTKTWLKKYCNTPKCDANNFHHVISYIHDCQAQQLLKEATAHAEAGNPDDAAHLLAQCWRNYPYSQDKEIETLNKVIKGMKNHPGANLPKRT
jgi:hypothetical protein